MNAEHKAWMEWVGSDEGERCVNHKTLNLSAEQSQFLNNRVWRAFTDGMEAGKRIASARVKQKLASMVDDAVRSVS